MQQTRQQAQMPSSLGSSEFNFHMMRNLVLLQLQNLGIPEDRVVSLTFTDRIVSMTFTAEYRVYYISMRALPLLLLPRLINILQDEHGEIKSRTVEMTTGASIVIEEVPTSNASGPPAPPPPPQPAAAAAGTAQEPAATAAAAEEIIDLDSQAATDERDSTDHTADAAEASLCTIATPTAAAATDAGPDCASLASSITELLQTGKSLQLLVGSCKRFIYKKTSVAADGRANKRRRHSSSSSSRVKNPLQVFICTPEMLKAGQAQQYLCMTDSAGLQQLERSLQQATCWAEVQRCVQPLATAKMMQGLAAMACHQG